jgi:thymidylate synthase
MLETTRYITSTSFFIDQLEALLKQGCKVAPRGNETKELLNQFFEIYYPTYRCILLPKRRNNIFAQIAETLWMIAGRDDIEWLSFYLPRAPQFSDNGRSWRGAYGPRLRNWNSSDKKVDQLSYVVEALKNDSLTRQAVISIWDPGIDTTPGKDIPCNNWLQFILRDGLLSMSVAQRSSDLIWGYSGIDAFSWSVLHEMMAYWTESNVHIRSHLVGSQHIYQQHYVLGYDILQNYKACMYDRVSCLNAHLLDDVYLPPKFQTPFDKIDVALQHLFRLELFMRNGAMSFQAIWDDIETDTCISYDPFLIQCAQMLLVYHVYQNVKKNHEGEDLDKFKPDIMQFVNKMEKSDFRLCAVEFMSRYMNIETDDMAHSSDVLELKRLNILQ